MRAMSKMHSYIPVLFLPTNFPHLTRQHLGAVVEAPSEVMCPSQITGKHSKHHLIKHQIDFCHQQDFILAWDAFKK